ncbi:MAG: hypothetical protein ACRBEE_11770 [Arenicella sp.]
MLKAGCLIISLWAILNLLASLFVVLIPVLISNESAPALLESLSKDLIVGINQQVLANANSIAVFANVLNIAISISLLFIVWFGLFKKLKWSFVAVVIILSLMLASGFFADHVSRNNHTWVNFVSGAIMCIGLLFSAIGIFKPKHA